MKLFTSKDITHIINTKGIISILKELAQALKEDFSRWQEFSIAPRHAFHYPEGVIELMPTTDDNLYSFKYVNGHPINTSNGKLSIIGFGSLADTQTGLPLMLCDMTLLTALRTAATSALAAGHLAKKNATTMALIGTGAQSEFQTLAMHAFLGIKRFQYYDIDKQAMEKYARNLAQFPIELIECESIEQAIANADIITTATARKQKVQLLKPEDIQPGVMLNSIGGDCPGKTELDSRLLHDNLVVVDFLEQALIEGEIQNINDHSKIKELWQLITGTCLGRETDEQVTIFDSVGCAVEDFSVLRYFYSLADSMQYGNDMQFLPQPTDPKNLYGVLLNP